LGVKTVAIGGAQLRPVRRMCWSPGGSGAKGNPVDYPMEIRGDTGRYGSGEDWKDYGGLQFARDLR